MNFEIATYEDIPAIAAIEAEHFKGDKEETKPYSEADLTKWMNRNSEMFYVVRDKNGEVVAHTIFVPITEWCYHRLSTGEINDMRFFNIDTDILPQGQNSDFYYTGSIAIRRDKQESVGVKAALMSGIANFFNINGKYVITTPVTNEGLKLTKNMMYNPISEEGLGKNYELDLTKGLRDHKRFKALLRLANRKPKKD